MNDVAQKAGVATDKTKSFLSEFKQFAMKGNVIDLAIAVVIGGAFGKIVNSLVANVISPILGVVTSGVNLADLHFFIGKAKIEYGLFIQSIIDFVIIAFCIFVAIKVIMKKEEPKPAPAKPADVALLEEIRDLLKGQQTPNQDQ